MTPGDLAFFKGNPDTPIDRVIMKRTQSVWVHVGVVVDHGLMLSSRSDGVRIEPIPTHAVLAATAAHLSAVEVALAWVLCQAGDAYGFGDILNQAILWVNSHTPGWLELPTLSFARHRDCSHLALDFLRIGGYPFPPESHIAFLRPETVTPGGLANVVLSVSGQVR